MLSDTGGMDLVSFLYSCEQPALFQQDCKMEESPILKANSWCHMAGSVFLAELLEEAKITKQIYVFACKSTQNQSLRQGQEQSTARKQGISGETLRISCQEFYTDNGDKASSFASW